MSPKQIVEFILFEQKTNANQLSKLIGISSTNFYDIMSGKIRNISNDLADKIVATLPEYNRAWLLTGEGSPHSTDSHISNEPEQITKDPKKDIQNTQNISDIRQICQDFIAEIAAQRETYSKQISDLISIVDKHLSQR